MKDKIEKTQTQDIIDLGVASVETQGIAGPKTEDQGLAVLPGISDE